MNCKYIVGGVGIIQDIDVDMICSELLTGYAEMYSYMVMLLYFNCDGQYVSVFLYHTKMYSHIVILQRFKCDGQYVLVFL